ncbi:DUF190 domain-containing protein [Amycolatopsis rubida]|uniref:DUF190 domain-containing protein n=1 Tax=Amycolatopsis rubida TaxID=112413 RepID=A0ABX0BTP1_9PSEU|nr:MULTISPECIES: DUF190 domain-containing protein [Amycolatopsis]MYW93754.1 DUF190 domain-containing protein [Amycolatopsis rubida]NEC58741.1 DUF190 domain-containing protein [Amycolatopsis rubida]OAP22936.1 hypothetical protein A4R44_06398 [Amycolatopsis sp. M39]
MQLTGYALRMSIFIGEDDVWHHQPLHREIVRRARDAGLAGATVLRGCEGYGIHAMIHTTRLLSMSEDLPVLILIVDREDKIRAFLPELDELIGEGAVLLDEVEVMTAHRTPRP